MSAENKLSFDQLPETVAKILTEVNKIRDLVEKDRVPIEKRKPIGIDEACILVKKAKPTIYALARKKLIPCCKSGGKLYFFEDQLLNWIDGGRRKTSNEILTEIEETQTTRTKRPTRRY